MRRACVIGAGLYGSQIATALEERGYLVVIIDDRRPLAGSAAAACLVNEAWIAPLGSDVVLRAYRHLKRYTRHYPSLEGRCLFYEPSEILRNDYVEATVVRVVPSGYGGTVTVDIDDPHKVPNPDFVIGGEFQGYCVSTYFDVIVVAAGVWTEPLLKHIPNHGVKVTGKMGTAIVWNTPRGVFPAPSFIAPWAPYKQIVGLQRTKDYWLGDGSAIIQANYTEERKNQSTQRCIRALMDRVDGTAAFPDHIIDGIRPYTPEPTGVCREVSPGIWAAVGARKHGTVLGAWCADLIGEKVP